MSRYYLFQDQDNCIGCHSCQIHCKASKSLGVGPLPSQIITVGPKMIHGLPRSAYVFMPCFHCQRPWCVAACPTGAMQKRPSDGIVFVDQSLCVGCKSCMLACPWGAPQWNPETRKVVKCDYCVDRLDQGLLPACVTNCTTKCLHFGQPEEIPNLKRERYARKVSFDREREEEPAPTAPARGWQELGRGGFSRTEAKRERLHGTKLPRKTARKKKSDS